MEGIDSSQLNKVCNIFDGSIFFFDLAYCCLYLLHLLHDLYVLYFLLNSSKGLTTPQLEHFLIFILNYYIRSKCKNLARNSPEKSNINENSRIKGEYLVNVILSYIQSLTFISNQINDDTMQLDNANNIIYLYLSFYSSSSSSLSLSLSILCISTTSLSTLFLLATIFGISFGSFERGACIKSYANN